MKHCFLFLLVLVLLIGGCKKAEPEPFEQFCGKSTLSSCSNDIDCVMTGCSGQICASKSEGNIMTSCEYQECYDFKSLGAKCGCSEEKCQWRRA